MRRPAQLPLTKRRGPFAAAANLTLFCGFGAPDWQSTPDEYCRAVCRRACRALHGVPAACFGNYQPGYPTSIDCRAGCTHRRPCWGLILAGFRHVRGFRLQRPASELPKDVSGWLKLIPSCHVDPRLHQASTVHTRRHRRELFCLFCDASCTLACTGTYVCQTVSLRRGTLTAPSIWRCCW